MMRDFRLDNLKGLLIFLVVFGHSLELFKQQNIISETIYIYIYMFHMPVFIFVSGYFSKNTEKSNPFKEFLVPYLFFNTIFNLFASIYTGQFSFIIPGWTLWYLLSMFFWKITIKDLGKVKFVLGLSIIIGTFIGFFSDIGESLSLSRTLVFLPFFIAGYLTHEEKLYKKINKTFATLFIILSIVAVSIFQIYLDIPFLYGSLGFAKFTNISPIILLIARALLYIIGFGFVFILVNIMPNKKTKLTKLGQNTYSVYILHTYLLGISFIISGYLPNIYLKLANAFIFSVLACYLLSKDIVSKNFKLFLQKLNLFIIKK